MNPENPLMALTEPVSEDTLKVLGDIQIGLQSVAAEFVAIEERKIHLLLVNKKLKDRSRKVFASLCVERGLSPDTVVEIDEHTKQLRVIDE